MASPLIALVLSFFIPGLGQFYTGQLLKAILLFVAAVIFGILSMIIIGIPFYLIVWIYSMFDAYTRAKEMNDLSSEKSVLTFLNSQSHFTLKPIIIKWKEYTVLKKKKNADIRTIKVTFHQKMNRRWYNYASFLSSRKMTTSLH